MYQCNEHPGKWKASPYYPLIWGKIKNTTNVSHLNSLAKGSQSTIQT